MYIRTLIAKKKEEAINAKYKGILLSPEMVTAIR
jgi:hypothetical protein